MIPKSLSQILKSIELDCARPGKLVKQTEMKFGILALRRPMSKFLPPALDAKVEYWRSIATRRSMTERLEKMLSVRDIYPMDESSIFARKAVSYSLRKFMGVRVKPISITQAFKCLPQTTSPGLPWNRLGFLSKSSAFKPCLKRVISLIRKDITYKSFVPCVGGARNQLCKKGDNKPRLTWVYPLEAAVLEARFYYPIFNILKACPWFAWSNNWLGGGVAEMFPKLDGIGFKLGQDIRGFDRTPGPRLIRWAFSVLRGMLVLSHAEQRQWIAVREYFVNTPIYLYDTLARKRGGVPSGSVFTQLIDCIINLYYCTASVHSLYKNMGIRVRPEIDEVFRFIKILGDDSVYRLLIPGSDSWFLSMTEYLARIHNVEIALDKSWCIPTGTLSSNYALDEESTSCYEFLGKKMYGSESAETSAELVLGQIAYPERIDECPGDVLTRIIGVCWMSGTSRVTYGVCAVLYDYVTEKWPSASPSSFDRDMKTAFKYGFLTEIPELVMPTFDQVYKRYVQVKKAAGRGLPPALTKRDISSGKQSTEKFDSS